MINYKTLYESINYYEKEGYKRIETPWTVSEQVDKITKPDDRISFQLKHNNKCLVGSGEQSFIYLMIKDFILPGKYQTITPCFRFESFDLYHTKYFMKNELIITDNVSNDNLLNIVNDAYYFFRRYFGDLVYRVETKDGYDLNVGEYELGSYGIRKHEYLEWIYGTGCAEPRMSKLQSLFGV